MTQDVKNSLNLMIDLKYSDSIERYISNEMSPSEKELFEKELTSNSGLANELHLSRSIDSAIMNEGEIDLRNKLQIGRAHV